MSPFSSRTTAFTCRAGNKERNVSKSRNAGPVKCNALLCVCSAHSLTHAPRSVFPTRAELASAEGRFSFCGRREPPSDDLWDAPGLVNLAGLDTPRYHDLPTPCVLSGHELGDCLGSRQPAVSLVVMAHPNAFLVRNPEVHTCDSPLIATLQFPQPLMRNIEIPRNGDSEHTARKVADRPAQAADAVPAN